MSVGSKGINASPVNTLVDYYLTKMSQGKMKYLGYLLSVLRTEVLYIPIIRFIEMNDEYGTKNVKVATIITQEQSSAIPVFTRSEFFNHWSKDAYESFSLTGGDLSLSMLEPIELAINPDFPNSVRLTINAVIELAKLSSNNDFITIKNGLNAKVEQANQDNIKEVPRAVSIGDVYSRKKNLLKGVFNSH